VSLQTLLRATTASPRLSLVDRLAALCDDMRSGLITANEAANRLEDLTILAALRIPIGEDKP
jgi:hypothetical protein